MQPIPSMARILLDSLLYTHTTADLSPLTAYIQAQAVQQCQYIHYVYRGYSFLTSSLPSLRLEAVILMWRAHHLRQDWTPSLQNVGLLWSTGYLEVVWIGCFCICAQRGKLDKPLCQELSVEGDLFTSGLDEKKEPSPSLLLLCSRVHYSCIRVRGYYSLWSIRDMLPNNLYSPFSGNLHVEVFLHRSWKLTWKLPFFLPILPTSTLSFVIFPMFSSSHSGFQWTVLLVKD